MDINEYWPSVAETSRDAGSPQTLRMLFALPSTVLAKLAAAIKDDSGPDSAKLDWGSAHSGSLLDSELALISHLPSWIAIAYVRALLNEERFAEAAEEAATLPETPFDEYASAEENASAYGDESPACWLADAEAQRLGIEEYEHEGPSRLEPSEALLQANRETLSWVRNAGTAWPDAAAAKDITGHWLRALASIVENGADPYGMAGAIVGENERYEVHPKSLVEWCEFLELPELARQLTPLANLTFLDAPPSSWELGMELVAGEAAQLGDVPASVRMRILQHLRAFEVGREAFSDRLSETYGEGILIKVGRDGSHVGPFMQRVVEVPVEADQFLELFLRTRLELGHVEEAWKDLPPHLSMVWERTGVRSPMTRPSPAELAYLAGTIEGAAQERRRRGDAEPITILLLDKMDELRDSAQRLERLAHSERGRSIESLDELQGVREDLRRSAEEQRKRLEEQADVDRHHRELRDELLRAWERTVAESEATRTKHQAQDLVGQKAWALLTFDTQREVLSYSAATRNRDDRFVYQSGRSLGYAFEVELECALGRSGWRPTQEKKETLGDLMLVAKRHREPILSEIGRQALQNPTIAALRNKAAHPGREFSPQDLEEMARRLFAGAEPEQGLLARVVMYCREETPTPG